MWWLRFFQLRDQKRVASTNNRVGKNLIHLEMALNSSVLLGLHSGLLNPQMQLQFLPMVASMQVPKLFTCSNISTNSPRFYKLVTLFKEVHSAAWAILWDFWTPSFSCPSQLHSFHSSLLTPRSKQMALIFSSRIVLFFYMTSMFSWYSKCSIFQSQFAP